MEFTNAKEQKQNPCYDAAATMSRLYHSVHTLMFGCTCFVQKTVLMTEYGCFSGCCFPKQGHREAIFLQCLTCVSKSRDNFHQARFAENPKDSEALQIVSQTNRVLHVFHPYYAPAFPSLILDHRNQQQRWVNSCRGSQHEQLELP